MSLDGADLLPLHGVPIRRLGGLRHNDVIARRVVVGMDDTDHLATLQIVGHGGNHQVDLALGEKLHAIGRIDRHELDLDTERLRDVPRHVRLEPEVLTTLAAVAPGL